MAIDMVLTGTIEAGVTANGIQAMENVLSNKWQYEQQQLLLLECAASKLVGDLIELVGAQADAQISIIEALGETIAGTYTAVTSHTYEFLSLFINEELKIILDELVLTVDGVVTVVRRCPICKNSTPLAQQPLPTAGHSMGTIHSILYCAIAARMRPYDPRSLIRA